MRKEKILEKCLNKCCLHEENIWSSIKRKTTIKKYLLYLGSSWACNIRQKWLQLCQGRYWLMVNRFKWNEFKFNWHEFNDFVTKKKDSLPRQVIPWTVRQASSNFCTKKAFWKWKNSVKQWEIEKRYSIKQFTLFEMVISSIFTFSFNLIFML